MSRSRNQTEDDVRHGVGGFGSGTAHVTPSLWAGKCGNTYSASSSRMSAAGRRVGFMFSTTCEIPAISCSRQNSMSALRPARKMRLGWTGRRDPRPSQTTPHSRRA
jgi:hypothetical protein